MRRVVRYECARSALVMARVMVASREWKMEGSDVARGERKRPYAVSLSQTELRYSLRVEPTYRDELWSIVRIRGTTPRTWLLDPSE